MAPQAVDFLNPDFALAALSADQLGVFVRLVFSRKPRSPTARAVPSTATSPVSRPEEESRQQPAFCSAYMTHRHSAGHHMRSQASGLLRAPSPRLLLAPMRPRGRRGGAPGLAASFAACSCRPFAHGYLIRPTAGRREPCRIRRSHAPAPVELGRATSAL